ncbi:MAG: hypothetical protein KKC46_04125 [Proteobacteria bacterium]|nr:hypothetical protein [Pseudomonadota bacterium]
MPAGGEGVITISLKTTGYGGKSVKKYIAVYTNDRNKPKLNLAIRGSVEKIVDISPKKAVLSGPLDKELSVSVIITPEEKYPFKIKEVKAKNGYNISVRLENDNKDNQGQYTVIVKNTAKLKRKYYDWVYIYTDSPINDIITIPVIGNIIDGK